MQHSGTVETEKAIGRLARNAEQATEYFFEKNSHAVSGESRYDVLRESW
jgi:hypothetical protein